LTRIQGYAITVHGAKPRDRVKVQITHVGTKTAEAKIIN
jgi:predicted RNA-binding protein with TRAM domain